MNAIVIKTNDEQISRNVRHAEFQKAKAAKRAAKARAKADPRFNPIKGLDKIVLPSSSEL